MADAVAEDFSATGGRPHQAQEHANGGGLAGSVRTDQTRDHPPGNKYGEIRDGLTGSKALAQPACLDRHVGRWRRGRWIVLRFEDAHRC